MTEEEIMAKLDVIEEKEDNILEFLNTVIETKEDTIIELLTLQSVTLNTILEKLNNLTPTETDTEEETDPVTDFKQQLIDKINEGLPYDQVKDWIIQTLTDLGIYSEEDIVIKIFTDIEGDIVLEIKTRPYMWWGKLIQFCYSNLGDTDYFETSRYTMKVIMWWKLTKNQQMEDQYSTTDIVDVVNEQWGDKDQIDFNNG